MVNMALVFVGFAFLIMLLLLLSTIYYVPRALADEAHGEDHGNPGSGHAH